MELKIYINEKKLSQTLFLISKVSKGKLRFFNDTTQLYISSHRENLNFCSILSRSPNTNCLCTRCNEAANIRCREMGTSYAYFCHANLVEIIYPCFYEGIYVGNIGVGQFRDRQKKIDETYLQRLSQLSGTSVDKLRKAYASQPTISPEEIKGIQILLEMTAMRLCENESFFTEGSDLVGKIERLVRDNLSSDLSLKNIANQVFMNPSYISAVYHKTTGVSLSTFIKTERVQRASYLLANTTMSIADVARSVGFKDANYFSRVFKSETDCLPREFRSKLAKREIIF